MLLYNTHYGRDKQVQYSRCWGTEMACAVQCSLYSMQQESISSTRDYMYRIHVLKAEFNMPQGTEM
jgi:hypothetical protein